MRVELTPGTPATVQFIAHIPGVLEVELHHTDTVRFQLSSFGEFGAAVRGAVRGAL